MKTFYSAQEIEDLARQGVRELVVDDAVVLTDLARQTAAQVGLRLVASGSGQQATAPRPAAAPAPAPAAAAPASATGQVPAKPRGCQHGPLSENAGPAGASAAAAPVAAHGGGNGTFGGKVVEDLVGLVRQMGKR